MRRPIAMAAVVALLAALPAYLVLDSFASRVSGTDAPDARLLENSAYKKVPGAFHALQLWTAQRAYPQRDITGGELSAAYAQKAALESTSRSASPPWEALGPLNTGGRMLAIAFNPQNPNTLYAGSASGGLWVTHTAGLGAEAWSYVPTGHPVLGVSTIAITPGDSTTMYIGTGEVYNIAGAGTGAAYRSTRGSYGIGILKTTNAGLTWSKALDWSMDQGRGVNMIKINPLDHGVVYAATSEGLYKTTNGGATWVQKHAVSMATDVLIHSVDTGIIVVGCGNFASTGHGLYRSVDGGDSWTQITAGVPDTSNGKIMLAQSPANPDRMFASIGHGFSSSTGATWLCRSDDAAATWTLVNTTDYSKWQGWFAHDVAAHPTDTNILMAIGIDLWKSNDGGGLLVQKTVGGVVLGTPPIGGPEGPPNYCHSDNHDVKYHPTDTAVIYIASDGGIFRSTDGGENFRSLNGGLQTTQFYNGISVSGTDSLFQIGGLQDNSTVSYHGSGAWKRNIGGDGSWTAIHPFDDNTVYASWQRLNLLVSFDQTTNWTGIAVPTSSGLTSFIAPFVISQTDPQVLYAARDIVYKSVDAGFGWLPTNGGFPLDSDNPVLAMELSPQNDDVVYAATAPDTFDRGQVFVTTNGGNSWTDITDTLPDRYFTDITVDPDSEAIAYITLSGYGSGHLFATDDYGSTWTDISAGLPDLPVSAVIVDPLNSDHIYAGNDIGVYFSDDRGGTWKLWSDGLHDAVLVMDLKISPSDRTLRMGIHGNGAWKRKLEFEAPTPPVGIQAGPSSPRIAVLGNPFRESLVLEVHLLQAEDIELSVTGLGGNLVYRQDIGRLAPGAHRLIWPGTFTDGTPVPAGMYLVGIRSSRGQRMVKVVKL